MPGDRTCRETGHAGRPDMPGDRVVPGRSYWVVYAEFFFPLSH
jgi:hypothetical protein